MFGQMRVGAVVYKISYSTARICLNIQAKSAIEDKQTNKDVQDDQLLKVRLIRLFKFEIVRPLRVSRLRTKSA